MESLQYHNGNEMDPNPVNTTFDELVEVLKKGESAVVRLEPGDATRYELLLVWAKAPNVGTELGGFGIRPSDAGNYIVVSPLNLSGEPDFIPFHPDYPVEEHHFSKLTKNAWSPTLYAWWFNILRDRFYSKVSAPSI